jgi:hypothetical protein
MAPTPTEPRNFKLPAYATNVNAFLKPTAFQPTTPLPATPTGRRTPLEAGVKFTHLSGTPAEFFSNPGATVVIHHTSVFIPTTSFVAYTDNRHQGVGVGNTMAGDAIGRAPGQWERSVTGHGAL